MKKLILLEQKCKNIEKSLLDMEISMIVTLLNSGVQRDSAIEIAKNVVRDSIFAAQLQQLKNEIIEIEDTIEE